MRAAHAHLLDMYRCNREALIHNDLHIGNILVGVERGGDGGPGSSALRPTGSLYLIDYEFATVCHLPLWPTCTPHFLSDLLFSYSVSHTLSLRMMIALHSILDLSLRDPQIGPMAYDIGSLMGNLLLAFIVSSMEETGGPCSDPPRSRYHSAPVRSVWLLNAICEFWELLASNLRRQTPSLLGPQLSVPVLWRDSLGFAALCMIRLAVGRMHYPPLDALARPAAQLACSEQILRLARELLLQASPTASGNRGRQPLQGARDLVDLAYSNSVPIYDTRL